VADTLIVVKNTSPWISLEHQSLHAVERPMLNAVSVILTIFLPFSALFSLSRRKGD